MTWWSINPRLEPADRKQAALALSSTPSHEYDEDGELIEPSAPAFSTTPSGLADCYNNAERLGLDLNSVGRIPSNQIICSSDDEED